MGQSVIITGANGALGTVVTRAFVAAGADIVAVSTKWPAEPEGALAVAADLATPAGCQLVVDRAIERFGRIDAVVHLVGGFAATGQVEETGVDTWEKMLRLNLWPAVHMLRAAIPPMKRQAAGRVVVVGSKAAEEAPSGLCAYSASKAAAMNLVRTAAAECRPFGVAVNGVLPGTIGDSPGQVRAESIAQLLLWLCISPAAADLSGALIPIAGRG
jgi:NAD(P)-dependent dehydrogenase (short-subunit alcohol dehydrogenase family)